VIKQEVTSGAMVATTLVLARALGPVEAAIGTWRTFVDARGAYRRLADLIARRGEAATAMTLPAPEGRVRVEAVVFGLSRADPPILKGIAFEIVPGDCLGVIGPSAAGKSTLARILTGIWKPTSGVARIDGADVSAWDRAELGAYLGYLPQDVELFPGTVGENIARLAPSEPAHIVQAAERAFAHDMILRLPRGYDTEVGEGGVLLYGRRTGRRHLQSRLRSRSSDRGAGPGHRHHPVSSASGALGQRREPDLRPARR
jgi:ABC-type protease/lipase transport system fused ATPase/permease subunit